MLQYCDHYDMIIKQYLYRGKILMCYSFKYQGSKAEVKP